MRTWLSVLAAIAAGTGDPGGVSAQTGALPHLERLGQATQLVVDGKPVLVLGGTTHK